MASFAPAAARDRAGIPFPYTAPTRSVRCVVDEATDRLEELCRIVIERIVVNDRRVESIAWMPQARPFFEKQRECPQGGSGTRPLSGDDPLAWYVA